MSYDPLGDIIRKRIEERWGGFDAPAPKSPADDWADMCEYYGIKMAEMMNRHHNNPDEEDVQITRLLIELRDHIREGKYK
jgi:hypothetical protein